MLCVLPGEWKTHMPRDEILRSCLFLSTKVRGGESGVWGGCHHKAPCVTYLNCDHLQWREVKPLS